MADRETTVVVGRIAGAYGVKGWVRVASFTDPPENLLDYRPWLLRGQPLEVLEAHAHGAGFVARVAGCEDREAAARLAGEIAVPASALPVLDEDEFYWRDLIGLAVANTAGESLGELKGFMASGANDVMVVQAGEVERLVPFTAAVVQRVDRDGRLIVVDWGLDY